MKNSILFILLVLSLTHCARQDRFKANLIKKIHEETPHVIKFETLTDFSWDRVFIFPPYTSDEKISQALGFIWQDAKATGIHYRDDICLLVFIKGNTVIHYTEYPRGQGDFATLKRDRYKKNEAVFLVKEEKGWIDLVDIK
ncbi:MAG: hypothetical protein JW827_04610 [Spirochaetes bacterium]|nr:hypothetical protein [Spirochaetota bacterium]